LTVSLKCAILYLYERIPINRLLRCLSRRELKLAVELLVRWREYNASTLREG
jgi:uncharacterized membrane protein (DUF4010 family)